MTGVSTSIPTKHSSITDGTMDSAYIRKVGNTIFASGRLHSFTAQPASGYFFQIPEGFRPQSVTRVMGYMNLNGGVFAPILASVYPNGIVEFSFSSSRTTDQVGFAGSWSVI